MAAPVARTVRIVVVHEAVLGGGGMVAQAASPVAAGTAATIVRPKAVIVAVNTLIFGPVFFGFFFFPFQNSRV